MTWPAVRSGTCRCPIADSWFRCNKAGYSLQQLEEHLAELLSGIVDRDPGLLAALESNPELLPMLLAGSMLELDHRFSPEWFGNRDSVRFFVDKLEDVVRR